MIAVLMRIGAAALPFLKGIQGILITATLIGAVSGTVIWTLNRQLDQAHADLAKSYDRLARVQTELSIVRDNRDQLVATIDRQSAQVTALQAAARAASERAAAAASVVIEAGNDFVESDRAVGSDPEEMNKWMRELFFQF